MDSEQPETAAAPPAAPTLQPTDLQEFYQHVFPVELVTRWLSYDIGRGKPSRPSAAGLKSETDAEDRTDSTDSPNAVKRRRLSAEDGGEYVGEAAALKVEGGAAVASALATPEGYLARREFCFTLLGDIFTRYRSFSSAAELRVELVRSFPEKIDAGAVYNVRPNQKQAVGKIAALERELVFDIDMSDYDDVRSCCSGKSICSFCWAWMSCAANVLRTVLEEDFGFKYLLPVFSGRRGVHLWVCDRRARALHNDERAAIVGYLAVVMPKTQRSSVVADLANRRPIHPTIRGVLTRHMDSAFARLFVLSAADNPNNMECNPAAASVVYKTVLAVLKLGRRDRLEKFLQNLEYHEGEVIPYAALLQALGGETDARDIMHGVQLLLMYPRLDEHVSTMREHLLKLPFCVHPGTTALCCPLTWAGVMTFNPTTDAPRINSILMERHIDEKWEEPIRNMLQRMQSDPDELAW